MAAEPNNDLSLPKQEAGLAFRAEMWATNAVLSYWRHAVALVAVGLLAILVYGLWSNQVRKTQREATAEIALAFAELPTDAVPGQETDDQKSQIRGVADELSEIGRRVGGPARAEAWLKAAELYRMLGDTEQQRAAFVEAEKTASGVLLYTARSGIANLDLEAGDGDAAIAQLKSLVEDSEGLLAEQAALDLAVAYEFLERPADARAVYTEFLAKWPDSPRAEIASERMARLDSGA